MKDTSHTYRSERNLKSNDGANRFGMFGEAQSNPFPLGVIDNSENNRRRKFAHMHDSDGA